MFRQDMKELLVSFEIDPDKYSGHSLRRGGATLVFQLGVHPMYVMILGDWSSLVVLDYNDAQPDFLLALPHLFSRGCFTP
jgi:hypothetical protein